jgi:hypothetical protein
MSRYVNLFSEFVKDVAQRLNIPYDKAMKKIETNKALQKEWREIKSERKELFVPVRTVSRSSAQSTTFAEPEQYAIPAQADYENFIQQQVFQEHRGRVAQQRRDDREALQRGLVLGNYHAVVGDDGDMYMNLFGDEDDDGVAAPPQQLQHQPVEDIPIARLQAAIRGKLERTSAKQAQRLQDLIIGVPQGLFQPTAETQQLLADPEQAERMYLLAELEKQVGRAPKRDRERLMEDIAERMSAREQTLIGYVPRQLRLDMENARKADEERARKEALAAQKIQNVAKARKAKAEGTAKKAATIDVSGLPVGLNKKERALLATNIAVSPPQKKKDEGLTTSSGMYIPANMLMGVKAEIEAGKKSAEKSTTGVGLKKGKIKGGASSAQIGAAAVMRNWVGNPLHDELNDITHSNDPDAKPSNRYAWNKGDMTYFQQPDPRATPYLRDAADAYSIAVKILHEKYDADIDPAQYANLHPAIKAKYTQNVDEAIRDFEYRINREVYAGNIPEHIVRQLRKTDLDLWELNKIVYKIRHEGFKDNLPKEVDRLLEREYPQDFARYTYSRMDAVHKNKVNNILADLDRNRKSDKKDYYPKWVLKGLLPDDKEKFKQINGFGLGEIMII